MAQMWRGTLTVGVNTFANILRSGEYNSSQYLLTFYASSPASSGRLQQVQHFVLWIGANMSTHCFMWRYKWVTVHQNKEFTSNLHKVKWICQVDSWHIKRSVSVKMSNECFWLVWKGCKAFGKILWWTVAAWSSHVPALLDVMCQNLDCFKCPMNLYKVIEVGTEAIH